MATSFLILPESKVPLADHKVWRASDQRTFHQMVKNQQQAMLCYPRRTGLSTLLTHVDLALGGKSKQLFRYHNDFTRQMFQHTQIKPCGDVQALGAQDLRQFPKEVRSRVIVASHERTVPLIRSNL